MVASGLDSMHPIASDGQQTDRRAPQGGVWFGLGAPYGKHSAAVPAMMKNMEAHMTTMRSTTRGDSSTSRSVVAQLRGSSANGTANSASDRAYTSTVGCREKILFPGGVSAIKWISELLALGAKGRKEWVATRMFSGART